MEERMARLHLAAARACGEAAACGKKVRHPDEYSAARHAEALNSSGKARNVQEPYPCPWCNHWHVGRQMSMAELQAASRPP